MIEQLPTCHGSYALRLLLPQPALLSAGRLEPAVFPAGEYFYLGSAGGPGGLRARLRHHARPARRPHWHIDWLRRNALFTGGWFTCLPGPMECRWSQALLALPGAEAPVLGFGASDCTLGCAAHLAAFPPGAPLQPVEQALRSIASDLQPFCLPASAR